MPFLFSKIEDAKDHILTGFILVFAIALLVARHEGGMRNTRVVAMTAVSYLEQPLSAVRVYRTALQTNRELHRENIQLLDELSRLRSARDEVNELRRMIEFRQQNNYMRELVPALIVGKDLTGLRNSLTINVGSNNGVMVGMPVVNSKGLVGSVILVSQNYSKILPFENSLFRVSASLQGMRAYGMVQWSGSGSTLIMNYVPQTIEVESGMIVETSGFSNNFPPNIPIGTVIVSNPEPGRDTQRIQIQPFVDLNSLVEVFVVRYQPEHEVDSLQTIYRGVL
jgi:rod shape-determining protein MreC